MLTIRPFRSLAPSEQAIVVSLLLADRPDGDRVGQIDQTLAFLKNGDPICLSGWADDHPIAALVAEILPGQCASLWPFVSRPVDDQVGVDDALLQAIVAALNARGIKVAQAILPHPVAAADALVRHRFHQVTSLWRMRHDLVDVGRPPAPPLGMFPQTDGVGIVFRNTLMSTFEDGLDFPELNGTRTPDEIVAGHLADAPDLSSWWLVRWEGQPAGVLILAEGETPDSAELAYFGVAARWRRRGIGRSILAFALRKSRENHASALSLRVDQRNWPAIDLYRASGFLQLDSREVFLRINS